MAVEVPQEMRERLKKQKIDFLTEQYFMSEMNKAAFEAIGQPEKAKLEAEKMIEYEKCIKAVKEL